MFKKSILIIISAAMILFPLFTTNSYAKKKKPKKEQTKETPKNKEKPFNEVIKDYQKVEGFFTFYINEKEGKTYMALKPKQLGKLYLCSLTRSAGDGSYYDSGADWGEFVYKFKRIGRNIQMLEVNVRYRADSTSTLYSAIKKGITNSIYGVAKIESAPDSTGAVLVNPAGFFIKDIPNVSYYLGSRRKLGYSFDSKNSYFGKIKSFPQNSEIDVHLHYKTKRPNSAPTIPSSYSMFLVYHYSITGIPETDYMPRIADDRVGYFLTMYQDYTDLDSISPYVRYINRWNLKKAYPELPISPPKKPIVFWLDKTIPKEYREYVKEGVLYWNKAFRKAGFEDAIVVKQMPDSADWDPADVRYNVIQWIVYPGWSYAVGPSHTNPFTGEIYDADIRICADFIRWMFLYSEEFIEPVSSENNYSGGEPPNSPEEEYGYCDYAVQRAKDASLSISYLEAANDDFEGKSDIVKKFVRQYIVDLVSHEVGHTLGLRHNFKASTIWDLKQINDTTFTRSMGMVGSTMDYNPANIALPGEVQGDYYNKTPGPYDCWAIEYGYTPIDASVPTEELPTLEKIASRSSDTTLVYGTDEDANGYVSIDPNCNQFDLGKEPLEYYRRRIELARRLWSKLEEKFGRPGTRYSKLRRIFGLGFGPFYSGASLAAKYIGGIYMHRDHIGTPDSRTPLVPVSASKQREAMQFLKENVFSADAFMFPAELLNKLEPERFPDFNGNLWKNKRLDYPIHSVVLSVQRVALNRLYNSLTLQRLDDIPLHYAAGRQPFTMTEMFTQLRRSIWTEIVTGQNINSFRRNLQREHLDRIIGLATGKVSGAPEDARTLARVDLKVLKGAIRKDLASKKLDTITRGHLEESLSRITAALEAKIIRTTK